MKRALVITITSILILIIVFVIVALVYFNSMTKSIKLDMAKFENVTPSIIFDDENNALNEDNYVMYQYIPQGLINAFTSIEDKKFFKHKGINVKRMMGAFIYNIRHGKKSQGASTITQQLIKNTHLSSEKTIDRKLKEIKLAIQLEKSFSKQEIMEKYLNSLYFGNGIYGIKRAALDIMGKRLDELNIAECATLAGIIKAPLYYSPLNDIDKATTRRNVVLHEMLEDKTISKNDYNKAINSPITINNGDFHSKIHDKYIKQTIIEASKILGITTSEVVNGGYNIATYYNSNAQKAIYDTINGLSDDISKYNHAMIVSDNYTCGIQGISLSNDINIFDDKRQVGSVIKPIAVYLPALEEGLIAPSTKYHDVKKSFGDYTPKDYNDHYRGLISIRDAVKYSSNIIPVELIDTLGITKSKLYLSKLGIDIEDNGLSIALGGLTKGISFNDILSAYSTIANGGNYGKCTFIKHITDNNGNVVYRHNMEKNAVFSDSSCYLMQNMLIETSKTGTARKLAVMPYQIAAKTGTVAHPTDKNYNIDAYNMSFTTQNTVLSWIGGKLTNDIQGGGMPTIMARNVYNELYDKYPTDFVIPNTVRLLSFDQNMYDKDGSIILSNNNTSYSDYFDIRFLPQDSLPTSDNIKITYKDDKLTIDNAKLTKIVINKYDIFGNKTKIKELFHISNHEELMIPKSIFAYHTIEIYYDENLLKSYKLL